MSNTATVLALDFGASSGRAIRAVYDGQNLTYEEIHRFENIPIEKDGHLCWDVETLLKEIHTAIQKAGTFDSLGFDTWGVDFGLLDTDGHLLANPVHYRDARTNGKPEQAAARMPAEELYAHILSRSWSNRHLPPNRCAVLLTRMPRNLLPPATCRAEYRNFAAKPASPSRKRWGT